MARDNIIVTVFIGDEPNRPYASNNPLSARK